MRKVILLMVLPALVVFALPTHAGKVKKGKNYKHPFTGHWGRERLHCLPICGIFRRNYERRYRGHFIHERYVPPKPLALTRACAQRKNFFGQVEDLIFYYQACCHQVTHGFNPLRRPLFSIRILAWICALTSPASDPCAFQARERAVSGLELASYTMVRS